MQGRFWRFHSPFSALNPSPKVSCVSVMNMKAFSSSCRTIYFMGITSRWLTTLMSRVWLLPL